MTTPVETVARSLGEDTRERFAERVAEQAERLREHLAAGDLDTEDFAVGLEMEVYAVSAGQPRHLESVPQGIFADVANVSKELGVHNAEVNTDPVALRPGAFAAQRAAIEDALDRAEAVADDARLVTDAVWTLPPAEGSEQYLSAVQREDGYTFAENMRADARYYAIDNEVLELTDGAVPLSVPGVERTFPTILYESLATSIQPHLQVPDAAAFPEYLNLAIRTLGPLLALSANSPLLPPDLYTDVADPQRLLGETHHELRIALFEQSVNHSEHPKVRVPRDLEATAETVDRVAADDCYAPFLAEWAEEPVDGEAAFIEDFPEFEHKRGTYWRWARAVIGGDPVDGAGDDRSIRIEYRPLPTQPTVRDTVALQALTAGLLVGLVATEHPLATLPHEAAEASFYDAAENGLDADLAWVRADGTRTDDPETIFEEVFALARRGLDEQGFGDDRIDELLAPLDARVATGTTPSQWKLDRVREALADGAAFPAAVREMQREYVRLSRETESFAAWLDA